jgi:O-antigen/teichoic acid export membrane protein
VNKKLFQNFSYLGGSQVAILLIGLITSAIWARYATVELYGKYQLLISFLAIVSIFSMPGMRTSAQLSSAKQKHGNLLIIWKRTTQFSVISAVVLLFIGGYYFFFKEDRVLAYMVFIAAMFYPFFNLKLIWNGWIVGISEFKKLSIINVCFSMFNLLILIIGFIFFQDIHLVILLIFGGISISNIVILRYFNKRVVNGEKDRSLIRYGYVLSGSMLVPVILSFDKLIISEYLSLSDVAIYSVALLLPNQVKILYSIIDRLVSPKISSAKSIEEAWHYMRPKMKPIIALFFVVGIVGFFTIGYIIDFIFTEKYQESTLYAKWLWLVVSFSVPATYMANILRSQQRVKFSYYFEAFNSIGKVGLFLLLVPIYQLWGMVYGMALMSILSTLFFIIFFNYELKKDVEKA